MLLAAQAEHAEHDRGDRQRQHPADEQRRRGADDADDGSDPAVDPPLGLLLGLLVRGRGRPVDR